MSDASRMVADAEAAAKQDITSHIQAPDAEALLLGCILAEPDLFAQAHALITLEHFVVENHRNVWLAMGELRAEGVKMDVTLVAQKLQTMFRRDGQDTALDKLGGRGALFALRKLATAPLDQAKPTCELLIERLARRGLKSALQTGLVRLTTGDDVVDIMAGLTDEARTFALSAAQDDEASWSSTLAKQVLHKLETGTPQLRTLSTGWEVFDELLDGGFSPGLHYIIGALSGHGKTTCGSSVVAGLLMQNAGLYVDWYGCEVPADWQFCRIASAWGGVPERFWKKESERTDELYHRAIEALGFGVELHDRLRVHRLSPIDMRKVAMDVALRRSTIGDADHVVVVDYIQRATDGVSDDPRTRIAGASQMLANLCDENTITIAMSQFTDAPTNQEPIPLPKPGHARWAKDIHHDACDWITYHRPSPESFEVCAVLQHAKSRYGKLGHVWALGTESNRFIPYRSAGSAAVDFCETHFDINPNYDDPPEPDGLFTLEMKP